MYFLIHCFWIHLRRKFIRIRYVRTGWRCMFCRDFSFLELCDKQASIFLFLKKNKVQKEEKILFSPFLKQFEIFYFLLYCTWFRAVLNRFLQVFILHIMFHFMQELHSNIVDLFPCGVVIQNSVFYSISLSGYFDCKSA